MKTVVGIVIILFLSEYCSAKWLCNHLSEKQGDIEDNENTVEVTNIVKPGELPLYGCIYKGYAMSDGTHTIQFKMQGNDGYNSVGVTSQNELSGSELVGYFYNGDLSSGKETLLETFGDAINDYNDTFEETVAFHVSVEKNTMKVYIKHDKTPLGLAYNIENQDLPLYPTVSFKGNGTVKYEKIDHKTIFETRRKATTCGGKYELSQFSKSGKNTEIRCVNSGITLSTVLFGIADEDSESTKAEGYYLTLNNDKDRGELLNVGNNWIYIPLYITCTSNTLKITKQNNSDNAINEEKKETFFEATKKSKETFDPVTKNVFKDDSNA